MDILEVVIHLNMGFFNIAPHAGGLRKKTFRSIFTEFNPVNQVDDQTGYPGFGGL